MHINWAIFTSTDSFQLFVQRFDQQIFTCLVSLYAMNDYCNYFVKRRKGRKMIMPLPDECVQWCCLYVNTYKHQNNHKQTYLLPIVFLISFSYYTPAAYSKSVTKLNTFRARLIIKNIAHTK